MSYNKYDAVKASNKVLSNGETETPEGQQNEAKAITELLVMAKKITDWGSRSSHTRELKRMIKTNQLFGCQGDAFLSKLIINQNPAQTSERMHSLWADKPVLPVVDPKTGSDPIKSDVEDFSGIGRKLLCWMLRDPDLSKFFTAAPSQVEGSERLLEMKPIHLAIERPNWSFLACFFDICYDPDLKNLKPKVNAVLEAKDENSQDRNCVHHAIQFELPFAPFLAAVCSAKALKDTDSKGYTPMHLTLKKRKMPKCSIPDCPRSAQNAVDAPGWDDTFSPPRILEEIMRRKDDPKEKLIETILTTTDKDGTSPFQEKLDPNWAKDHDFPRLFKKLIFDKVEKISDVSKALYGTKGDVKELCLDMSDFNQSSHNFETFVDKLTQLDADLPEKETVLRFEDTLFFVNLPDLNYVRQPCPHHTMQRLFGWLGRKGVRRIKKLSIPDNTTNPLSEAFVQQYIIDAFDIEELDWRKLDINLDIITGTEERRRLAKKPTSDTWKYLTDLTLYSSGNWSVLYHWVSKDGLAKLPGLNTVRINIVHLNPAEGFYDVKTHERHLSLANEYKLRIENEHTRNKRRYEGPSNRDQSNIRFKYRLDVKPDAKWDYPPPLHEPEEPTTQILKHQFTGQLLPSLNALREWEKPAINLDEWDYLDEEREDASIETSKEKKPDPEKVRQRQKAQFQTFALDPQRTSSKVDRRIRVAIIDNGADRIRSKFRHMIAKGQSYVKADLLGSDRSLPWWMVSDPHGTQMASLIGQTNDYCRLYIARVGKGRNDVDPANAAEAIDWAVEQKVDIISISWTLKQPDEKLKKAIDRAIARPTLIFCSTPDEGVYSQAWPVGYRNEVLSVSATDHFGHLTTKTAGTEPVDIQIPGENIRAAGPAYIGNVLPTVSGSSVATALAAGIASLALLLLRTFNPELGAPGHNEMKEFYTKKGIMRVFRGMGADKAAIKLSKLFPDEATDESKTLEKLAEYWNVNNLPDPVPSL